MLILRFVGLTAFSLSITVLNLNVVSAQTYPSKPVRIYAVEVGSGGDFVARIIAQGISPGLGQSVVVENRPSALIGEVVAATPPDGYSAVIAGNFFWLMPLLQKTAYDPVRDFAPITLTSRQPTVLAVHPSVPAKSVKELIALAKARPGDLNYGSAATGTTSHLAAELLKSLAGVNIVRVSYRGNGLAINDLISGNIQLVFSGPASMAPFVKSGKLRALAITNAQPSPLAPGLPTITASGLPGYEFAQISGMFAPAKTPPTVINRLNQEVVRFLNTPEAKEKFSKIDIEAVGNSPEELGTAIKSEIARMGKVIKDAGIKAD